MPGPSPERLHQTRNLTEEIDRWTRQLDEFRARAHPKRAASDDLEDAYEELSVAEEELRTQNEALAAAQIATDLEREQYRELFDQAPVAYVATDLAGTIEIGNTAMCKLTGVAAEHLPGKPLAVFIDSGSRARFRHELSRIVQSGESTASLRLTLVDRRHLRHESDAVVSVVRDPSMRVVELRWLLLPDSVMVQAERDRAIQQAEHDRMAAQASDRAKTQLMAAVSHELRTPLTAIGGYSELLEIGLRGALNDDQLHDVQRIRSAQQHMLALLDDLLLYFRLGLGGLSADVSRVAIAQITTGLSSFVAPQANQRRIAVEIDAAADDTVVMADVDRARQVLINLLNNAVKFSPADGTVSTRVVVTARDVVVEVHDDGPGIPADRLASIFEPFVQLDPHNHSRTGFGLGLAISRKLAALMGGDLAVASSPGAGSTFSLTLRRG